MQTPVTDPDLSGSISLPLTPLCAPFRLPWPSSSCSCCPSIQPGSPLLLLQFKLPAPTLDLAPGLSPLAPVPLLPPAWMDLSSGKVWPHVARLSRIQVISSDRRNRLLPESAALRGRRDGETEKRRETVRVDLAKEVVDECGEEENRKREELGIGMEFCLEAGMRQ